MAIASRKLSPKDENLTKNFGLFFVRTAGFGLIYNADASLSPAVARHGIDAGGRASGGDGERAPATCVSDFKGLLEEFMGCEEESREQRVRAGQFVNLLTAHQRDLYAYINTLLVGDPATADVLQDTNLDLWKRLDEFDYDRPFLPWAYSFAHQRVLAYRKTRSRSRLVFSDQVVQLISDAYISDTISADTRLSALQACLDKLECEQRQLIRDRYMGRVSVKVLAAQLGATASQISARLYRIRRALAKCVEAKLAAEAR